MKPFSIRLGLQAHNSLVERPIAEHVRHTVYAERNIQRYAKAKIEVHPERHPQAFVPTQPRHQHRHPNGDQSEEWNKVSLLPHDDRVRFQIGHVDVFALLHHRRTRRQEHPADVGEKESAPGVVRVRIGFRIFVVDAVVQRPRVSVSLQMANKTNVRTEQSNMPTFLHALTTDTLQSNNALNNFFFLECVKIKLLMHQDQTTNHVKIRQTIPNSDDAIRWIFRHGFQRATQE